MSDTFTLIRAGRTDQVASTPTSGTSLLGTILTAVCAIGGLSGAVFVGNMRAAEPTPTTQASAIAITRPHVERSSLAGVGAAVPLARLMDSIAHRTAQGHGDRDLSTLTTNLTASRRPPARRAI